MIYKYYLDAVLLDEEPLGWSEMTNKIERVDEVKGIFITVDLTLTLYGYGFDTLIASYGQSFCNSHTITIDESCDGGVTFSTAYEGIIFISDCTFDYNRCTVEAKVQDNSFYAKINNNKSVKTLVEIGSSKNGVAFTGASDYQVELFNPCDGTYYVAPRTPHCVRVFEAFRVLVAFMTDNAVGFSSSYFDVGGEGEGYCVTDGIHLSSLLAAEYSATRNIEKICFGDLFSEMDKKFNLGMMIDTSSGSPVLVIEQASFFKNSTSVLSMTKINGFKASVDVNRLFSQVRFGANTAIGNGCPAPALAFPEDSVFTTFKDETFYILGTCNIDKTLDLYSQWNIDSNIIQDCVVNNSENYDSEIFILETTYVTANTGTAIQGNPFNEAAAFPRYYNESLMNSNVGPRYLGAVPNTIAEVLSGINDIFSAHMTTDIVIDNDSAGIVSTIVSPIPYQDDSTAPDYYDPGGNFTLATGRYTALVTGGNYRFQCVYRYYFNKFTTGFTGTYDATNYYDIEVTVRLVQHDGVSIITTDEEVRTFSTFPVYPNSVGFTLGVNTQTTFNSKVFTLSINDYVYSEIEVLVRGYGNCASESGSTEINFYEGFYKSTYTSNGGGTLTTYDPDEYPAFKFEFEYPLTTTEFQLLLDQPNYAVTLDVDGENTFKAYIQQAEYKRKTGMAQFTCIASKSIDD